MLHTSTTKVLAGFAASAATGLGLLSIAAPASADFKPEGGSTSPVQQGPPSYQPQYPIPPVDQADGLDASSIALGALGGISLGGAGLAITLGIQRRRDHTGPHPA